MFFEIWVPLRIRATPEHLGKAQTLRVLPSAECFLVSQCQRSTPRRPWLVGGQDSVSPLFYELGQEQGDLLPPRAGQTPKKHLTPL